MSTRKNLQGELPGFQALFQILTHGGSEDAVPLPRAQGAVGRLGAALRPQTSACGGGLGGCRAGKLGLSSPSWGACRRQAQGQELEYFLQV